MTRCPAWMTDAATARPEGFPPLDLVDLLTRLAYRESRADLLALGMLNKSGAPLLVSVSQMARDLGVRRQTVAAQLRDSPEVSYIPRHRQDGGTWVPSLICLPADELSCRRRLTLPICPVDNPGDNPVEAENGGGRSTEPSRARALPPERREGGRSTVFCPLQGVDPVETLKPSRKGPPENGCGEMEQLAAALSDDFEHAGLTRPPVRQLAALLAALEIRLAPFCDHRPPLELAAAAVREAAGHYSGTLTRDGPSGFRWGAAICRDPNSGLRRGAMIRALGRGWGRSVWRCPNLDGLDRARLRAAADGWNDD